MLSHNPLYSDLDKFKSLPWKTVLFTVGFGFFCANITNILISSYVLFPITNIPKNKKRSKAPSLSFVNHSTQKNDLEQIIERNIFNKAGETGESSDIQQEVVDEIKDSSKIIKSSLPFKLIGTFYGGDPYSGIATIEEINKNTINSFLTGSYLTYDVELIEIHPKKIILLRGEQKEYIEMEDTTISGGKKNKKADSAEPKKVDFVTDAPPETYKEAGFERNGNSIVMSKDFRKKLLTADFAKMLQDAKAEPVLVGGELNGFKLTRIRQDSIYAKAGLQESDIVKEINGISLVDTAQTIKLLNSLRGENELEVRVIRGGAQQTINLKVQ